MWGVLQGIVLIVGVIGSGYLAARCKVVTGDQPRVLSNVAFYVATPALLFGVLWRSDPSVAFSPVILLTTLAAVIAAALYVIASRIWFRRDLAATTLGAATAGYVNANNLGLPVAVYILGDAAYVAPLILVQLLVFSPAILALLETAGSGGGMRGILIALRRTVTNPIIIASFSGFIAAILDLQIPDIIMAPLDMIGAAAIPMVLLSFGMSLIGRGVWPRGPHRAEVLATTAIKAIGMPLIAWALAVAFHLDAHSVFAATIIGALPSAQNIFNYASVFRQAEDTVRDTVFLTTCVSLPIIACIALLLG